MAFVNTVKIADGNDRAMILRDVVRGMNCEHT